MRTTSELKNPRSVSLILAELKQELKEFFGTRTAILKAEYREKLAHIKVAAPLAAVGVVLLLTAHFLITLAIVAVVGVFIDNGFRWAIAFGAVGIVWALLGGIAIYVAKREFELNRLAPQKTLEVLRGDKTWLQREVRNQYEHSTNRNPAA